MLSTVDKRAAQILKRRLQKTIPVQKLVVYGSRARGDASPDSDLDVYIEVAKLTPVLRRKISDIAWEIGYQEGLVISTFVVTPQSLLEGPISANPILKVIEAEGILV